MLPPSLTKCGQDRRDVGLRHGTLRVVDWVGAIDGRRLKWECGRERRDGVVGDGNGGGGREAQIGQWCGGGWR